MLKTFLILMMLPGIILGATIEVKVLGLVCSSCGIGIKKNLMKTKKVDKVTFDIKNHLTYIHTLESDTLTDKEIYKAITRAGYKVSAIKRENEK